MSNKLKKSWQPTKFILNNDGRLIASRDPKEVGVGSRLIADLAAEWYDTNIKEFAHGKLLDLGCGKAPLYDTYKPLVDGVILADWGNSLHENKLLDVECDITKKLPFKDGEFDTIILSDVLEHVPNPIDLTLELKRILKPGGLVLMNVPFMYWVHEAPYDYHRYTEFMLRKMVEDANMRVIKLDALGGGWVVLIDLLSKLFMNRPKVVNAIQKLGPKLLASRLKIRNELPIGYAMVYKKGNSR